MRYYTYYLYLSSRSLDEYRMSDVTPCHMERTVHLHRIAAGLTHLMKVAVI